MGNVADQAEPEKAGFDPERLQRIDRHFARYVDEGKLPGWQVAVSRQGHLAHWSNHGHRDKEAGLPVADDTIWRIYSMTKPITAVAAMLLVEEGAFELKDPVSRFIPSFGESRVFRGGSSLRPDTEPVTEPMLVWHLLTHTSGLTYGFHNSHPVDAMYRAAGFELGTPPGLDTAGCCDAWAGLPLLFQPGTEWNYGVSTDVLGHLVEVASGQRLDDFCRERIFEPLGMVDTDYSLDPAKADRLAGLYVANPADGSALRFDGIGPVPAEPPAMLGGGGGLVSTLADYLRFCHFLQRGGSTEDGRTILGPRTVEYMATNHLPGGADLEAFGRPLFSETTFEGVGFGLGVSVGIDPAANKVIGSVGEYGWGGAASTVFWVDPVEDMTVVFMTSLLPSSTHPIRSQLKTLVHQALR
jgi:CubicO group peptidase (beta-lactamase class C family)